MAKNWRGLCPAVDCSGLMMKMMRLSGISSNVCHHHHQRIKVLTAEAQALLRITHKEKRLYL
jgi:hypothetical protein